MYVYVLSCWGIMIHCCFKVKVNISISYVRTRTLVPDVASLGGDDHLK
jgi:hypothetical protein